MELLINPFKYLFLFTLNWLIFLTPHFDIKISVDPFFDRNTETCICFYVLDVGPGRSKFKSHLTMELTEPVILLNLLIVLNLKSFIDTVLVILNCSDEILIKR